MRAIAILSISSLVTINELSLYAVTEQSTMSRTVDALEEQGLSVGRRAGRAKEIHGGRRTDRGIENVDYKLATVFSTPSSARPSSSRTAACRSRLSQAAPSSRSVSFGSADMTRSNFESPRAWVSA